MGQDFRTAVRGLVKNPGFTVVAVLALALGIGANTAIFTVVDRVLLRPLPYNHADRLIHVVRKFRNGSAAPVSIPKFALIRQAEFLDAAAIYDFMGPGMNLSGTGAPEQVRGIHVSQDYFRVFGVRAAIGRTFAPEEDRPGGARVVVLANGLWKRRFGGDAGIMGGVIRLNSEPFTVIGVMGPDFAGEPETDLFLAQQADLNSTNQGHFLLLGARLKPGISLDQANAQLRAVTERFRRQFPGVMSDDEYLLAQPMGALMSAGLRTPLLVLLGAVAFVLLIACANVANLLLVRGAARGKEIAIRVAIGAGRLAIVRQLLAESLLLSFMGGVAGVLLAAITLPALLALAPAELPRIPVTRDLNPFTLLDGRVLVFALGISVFTGILFGLLPALQASRTNVNASLREGGARTTANTARLRTRSALVVAEIALSLVLLVGATLMLRTFMALRNVRPGFETTSVLTMSSSLAGQKYATAVQVERLTTEASRRLESLPGVTAAGYALTLPLQLGPDMPFQIAGKPAPGGGPYNGDELYRPVSAHYFQALGIPLRRGRLFDERDGSTGPWALIINEAMAKKYWPNEDPIGAIVTIAKGLAPEMEDRPRQVIGIVANVHEMGLDQNPPPILYVPVGQTPNGMIALANRILPASWAVRSGGDTAALARAVPREVLRIDAELPVARVMTMDRILAKSIAQQNFDLVLLGVFGGIALLLASIGIYGVMSYTVQQRTNEMGIRIALGAARSQLLRLVIGRGLALAAIGVAIGLAASAGLTRLMSSLLYGVKATDIVTFVGVAVVLSAVATLACYVPARRATRVDPIVALHCE